MSVFHITKKNTSLSLLLDRRVILCIESPGSFPSYCNKFCRFLSFLDWGRMIGMVYFFSKWPPHPSSMNQKFRRDKVRNMSVLKLLEWKNRWYTISKSPFEEVVRPLRKFRSREAIWFCLLFWILGTQLFRKRLKYYKTREGYVDHTSELASME